jgi:hypothetical protein
LERVASKRTAVWIDAGALGPFGDREREWVIRMSRKKYPFVLVGYKQEPSFDAMLGVTNRLLAGEPVP